MKLMSCDRRLWLLALGSVTLQVIAAAAWFRKGTNWGATAAECDLPLPGDATVPIANYRCTRAITIDAEPRYVWPWLMQMGNGRGGLYSIDWLDRLFGILHGPSAREILPGYSDLEPGDVIPIGRGGDFPVLEVEHERALVLGGGNENAMWLWSLVLHELPGGQTRLLSRNRGRVPAGPRGKVLIGVVDAAATIMTRRMLLNLKNRAEQLRAETAPLPLPFAAVQP